MKTGAVLANAGYYDYEVDVEALKEMAVAEREVRPNITEYELRDGRKIHVIARGRLVNIAAGDGHPVEIMDLTFAVQALNTHYLANHAADLRPGLQTIPPEIDERVARTKLATLGIDPDTITEEQEAYLNSWR